MTPDQLFVQCWNQHQCSEHEREHLKQQAALVMNQAASYVFDAPFLRLEVLRKTQEHLVQNCIEAFANDLPLPEHELLARFYSDCWMQLQWNRIGMLTQTVNARESLTHSTDPSTFHAAPGDPENEVIYQNTADKLHIDFIVERLPFPLQILDPRIVRIPPGKNNELHKHAHETVFIFLKGRGTVKIDAVRVPVEPGSIVFIPRWCLHQSCNEGPDEMCFLAVADFGFTGKSFTGNYLKTARLKP